ncbi:MAG TPA: hypothetical protein VLS92_06185 [Acidimicrobiia bacterium]|nr:hypothetical protein [Acidimicrobiia bacterium]
MASAPRPLAPALLPLAAALTAGGLAAATALLLKRRRPVPAPAGTWHPVAP